MKGVEGATLAGPHQIVQRVFEECTHAGRDLQVLIQVPPEGGQQLPTRVVHYIGLICARSGIEPYVLNREHS